MIERQAIKTLNLLGKKFPDIAITGPRQIGKTTLAKEFAQLCGKDFLYLDLENQSDLDRLQKDLQKFMAENENKLVVLDEVQHLNELFPAMRSMIDKHRVPLRFMVLGSASPDMIRHSFQSLAGRISYNELMGLSLSEVASNEMDKLWLRGGFPEPFPEEDDFIRKTWFGNFLFTFSNRDLQWPGMAAAPSDTTRLITMLAHLSGKLLKYETLADSLGLSVQTTKKYVNFLEEAYLIRKLQPFYINIHKRTIKAHKVFVHDSGLCHYLLGIHGRDALLSHPAIGASFESFVIEQIANAVGKSAELSFFGTHNRGELDLIISSGPVVKAAIEIKYAVLTRGNTISFQDMMTDKKYVVTPSSEMYNIRPGIVCCSLAHFLHEELPNIL